MGARSMASLQLLLALLALSTVVHTVSGDDGLDVKKLDCRMRELALDYARKIHPWRPPNDPIFHHIHEALQLDTCPHVPRIQSPVVFEKQERKRSLLERGLPSFCRHQNCIFVETDGSSAINGTLTKPLQSVNQALMVSRTMMKPLTIVLGEGVHFLDTPLKLGLQDAGLRLQGLTKNSWLSGGIVIPSTTQWTPMPSNPAILMADLSQLLKGKTLPKVASLLTPSNRRYIRARYPNSDPETNSKTRGKDLPSHPDVLEWTRPPKGEPPTFDYIDFASNNRPPNVPVKNDSTMPGYNVYASGHGGVCEDLWGPNADSYWCSNSSAGGWAFADEECAKTGRLQIPIGMTYNQSDPTVGSRMAHYKNATGGLVFAWHTQGWAMHMFEIESHKEGTMKFAKGGGAQGGRNWQRCGQITPSWCGQKQDPPDDSDERLVGGSWFIENILEELDQPGEFYFDAATQKLYVMPNGTDSLEFRFPLHDTLINVANSNNITISNLGFRDTAATFMNNDWSAPSGGDWSLHRGGAIFIEDSEDIVVRKSLFQRLDGNAIFLSKRVRCTHIVGNTFEWLGEGAIATWGQTKKYDATEGLFPMDTTVSRNVMRELGIYEKQSSAVGLAKSAKTYISKNIMFNMPRAAVNFNDGLGGGDVMEYNLLFNTCRESGDHGPVNSWDRQPFLTTLRSGHPSFTPLMRTIRWNYIFANYGAAQGVGTLHVCVSLCCPFRPMQSSHMPFLFPCFVCSFLMLSSFLVLLQTTMMEVASFTSITMSGTTRKVTRWITAALTPSMRTISLLPIRLEVVRTALGSDLFIKVMDTWCDATNALFPTMIGLPF